MADAKPKNLTLFAREVAGIDMGDIDVEIKNEKSFKTFNVELRSKYAGETNVDGLEWRFEVCRVIGRNEDLINVPSCILPFAMTALGLGEDGDKVRIKVNTESVIVGRPDLNRQYEVDADRWKAALASMSGYITYEKNA